MRVQLELKLIVHDSFFMYKPPRFRDHTTVRCCRKPLPSQLQVDLCWHTKKIKVPDLSLNWKQGDSNRKK